MIKKIFIQAVITGLVCALVSKPAYSQNTNPRFKDLIYAEVGQRKLLVDIYSPSISDPYLVVWIHGGAWHSGSKDSPPLGLLQAGYALASVDYRLSTEAKFPAQIHDIKAAIRFLRANAGRYGFRSDKFIIWGSSAGGHLAALVGVTNGHPALEGSVGTYPEHSSSVQAIIDFYGPTDFLTILDQSTLHGINVRAPALALLLGKPIEQISAVAREASPVHHIDASDPPIFIAHGDRDIQVPVNQSHELEGAYKSKGLISELKIVHGAGHNDDVYYKEEFLKEVEYFLSKVIKN